MKDVYVVMIGAGSAMGPFPKLLEMGATVVAIDIPGNWGKGTKRPTSTLWKRCLALVSLLVPARAPRSAWPLTRRPGFYRTHRPAPHPGTHRPAPHPAPHPALAG